MSITSALSNSDTLAMMIFIVGNATSVWSLILSHSSYKRTAKIVTYCISAIVLIFSNGVIVAKSQIDSSEKIAASAKIDSIQEKATRIDAQVGAVEAKFARFESSVTLLNDNIGANIPTLIKNSQHFSDVLEASSKNAADLSTIVKKISSDVPILVSQLLLTINNVPRKTSDKVRPLMRNLQNSINAIDDGRDKDFPGSVFDRFGSSPTFHYTSKPYSTVSRAATWSTSKPNM